MPETGSTVTSGAGSTATSGAESTATSGADGDTQRPVAPARPAGLGRGARLGLCAATGLLALGTGFGLTRLVHPPGPAPLSSVIPSPAKTGGVFTEDDDGTAQDSESNILRSTAPGLVHIMSGGQAAGLGLVLTPSGKVLTTYQPSAGTGGLSARYVLSGKTFKVAVLGTDAADGLALLQLEGGDGRAFPTLTVGNSATIADNAYASRQSSYHITGEVFDTAVGASGTQDAVIINTGLLVALNQAVTVDGQTRTGLLSSRLQSAPAAEIGGPLVNLNGQVIGITVAGGGTGLKISGYAMPVNQALAIARQIDDRARHTS